MHVTPPRVPRTVGEVRDWLIADLAEHLKITAQAIDVRERFNRYGLSSQEAVRLLGRLSAALERPLAPTLIWEYPTIEALALYLVEGAPLTLGAGRDCERGAEDEPIAIIGLACRFPQAPSAAAFWRLLRDGVDAITEAPAGRMEFAEVAEDDSSVPAKMYVRRGGFLEQVDRFDPQFFGISPREAVQMDPQQRLALELSWEALEDACIAPASQKESRTGVFFGAMWMDYARLADAAQAPIVQHTVTGQDLSIVPARVSYTLGLNGPSLLVNTACSSSLVAVHLACQSLLRGESSLALVGGVNLLVAPESTLAMVKFGAMAPDGRSKAFDARADGYVRGEGGGVVVLKRLSQARGDGDRIYCVIRGSAINNDGFSNGLTAPSPRAQEAVLREAYAVSGVAPAQVQYVEAHGTGTQLGDPIEAGALGAALGAGRSAEQALIIGSVKTNIGHLEAAAGIAGLIKVALAMQHRMLPPSLHFQKPNPHIAFDALRLRVQTTLAPWQDVAGRLLAGVSSFGFGGTNCHVVVEANVADEPRLCLLSAGTQDELGERARQLVATLRAGAAPSLAAVCEESARETPAAWRLAAVVRSQQELLRQLEAFGGGQEALGLTAGRAAMLRPRVAFVFGGQGSQWRGMGRALLHEQAARAVLEQCDRAMRPYVAWSLVDRLRRGDAEMFDQTDFVQPALFALQLALAAAWRVRGLTPDAVVGQSVGEVAAACVAGALSLADAARIVCRRSQLVARVAGQGGMAVVELALAATAQELLPYGGQLSVAVCSGPQTTVVAGDETALQALLMSLQGRGVFCRSVRVDYASHSVQMDPLLPELRQLLAGIAPRRGPVAFYSTVVAAPLDGSQLDAAYWARNLREPVLFAPTVRRLAAEGIEVFVEVDPHTMLVAAVEQCLKHDGRPGMAIGSARRDESERVTLLEAVGRLFVAGVAVRAEPALAEPAERAADQLLTLSAKSAAALGAQALRLRDHIATHPDQDLGDVAFSLATTRSPMEHRLAVVTNSRAAVDQALTAAAAGQTPGGVARGTATAMRGKLAFLFPGQGAQVLGMGRGLYQAWPAFREAFDRCVGLFDRELERPLRAVMWAEAGSAEASWLDQTAYTQPALFAHSYALSALWESWGVRPELVGGHSLGELVAACVAGVFSLEDGVRLVAARGRLMQALPEGGAMRSIAAPEMEVAAEMAGHGSTVSIAAINGPALTVIAGDEEAVEAVAAAFAGRGVKTKRLVVSHAFHSARMEPMLAAFAQVAATVRYEPPTLAMVSNLSGKMSTEEVTTPAYWVRHVREVVRFGEGVKALAEAGAGTFVEVGPKSVLLGLVPACLPGAAPLLLASLRAGQEEAASVLEAVGGFWAQGGAVTLAELFPEGGRRVPLPTYPWQRERYWIDIKPDGRRAATAPFADWVYQLSWRELPRAATDAPHDRPGPWLVLADHDGVGAAVTALLTARGHSCTVIHAPAQAALRAEQVATAVAGRDTWQGVIYLWGLNAVVDATASAGEVGEATQRATAPVLALIRALGTAPPPPRVWIVTRGACTVGGEPGVAVSQAALWGLGRVASLEHPAAWGGLVDLDPAGHPTEAATLVAELLAPDAEGQLAFRAGRRHAARLVAAPPQGPAVPLSLSAEASYLVTGGLGALGLLVAQWLVARGARHLVLTSRHGLPERACRAAIEALEAQGVRVTAVAVDVADGEQMTALLAAVAPPLRGVVHAAGIGPVCPLAETDELLLESVLRPKVVGGWLLHQLLRDRPLDLFVLFSSGAAVWGGHGQGAYAAANAFLDGLAQQRHAQSLPALSVAWGVWAEGGMGKAEAQASLGDIGVLAMPTAPALAALEYLLGTRAVQRTVTRVDWTRFAPVYSARGRRNLLAELVATDDRPAAPLSATPAAVNASWRSRPAAEARAGLYALVRETVAQVLGFAKAGMLDPGRGFAEQGLDSLMAVQLGTRLAAALGVPLAATLAFDHPTVERLVLHLLAEVRDKAVPPAAPAGPPGGADEPIAIVGAACRFPGDVEDVASYWQLLTAGRVVTTQVPASRWNAADYYDPDPAAAGRTCAITGGFLRDVETFDPAFFRISPREALSLDPQQRLLLEVSWEAIEHSGQDPLALRDSATGVFVGAGPNEYAARLTGLADEAAGVYGGTGNMLSVTAGRLAFFLGLHGPALAVDTACSSSLVALHLGCQSLRAGECERALVGGVNVLLSPQSFVMLSRLRALAPDGRCKTFSALADGYARAEGCGVVVLKRLSAAQRDGDRILAVIRGSAVNHDGPSSGLTVPNGPAQQAVLLRALAQAGVAPAAVDFVECHGTGTALGDPIEVQALSAVYGQDRPANQPLLLGASKANLGHLESAAGMAGLLKVILALGHEQIPAQPELQELNPLLPWATLPVAVVRAALAWPRGIRPRRAGVSAFGMSGTNAHVVLEEAPWAERGAALPSPGAELVVLSAQSAAALAAQALRLRDHLTLHSELGLGDVAFSLATTRSALAERLAVATTSRAGLLAALAAAAQGQTPAGGVRGCTAKGDLPKVVFVFPGQGSQWLGMGRQLLAQEPCFRAALAACDLAIQAEAGFSLLAELGATESASQLERIDVVQPVLFAISVALAALWRSWGVTPDAVVGHSMGEVAAAHVAGALSLADAVAIICRRSRLLHQISGQGEMAMVELSLAAAEQALVGYAQLSVAVSNSPRSTVIAGDPAALAEVLAALAAKGVFCRRVKVPVASHSPQVDPLLQALVAALVAVQPQAAAVPMRSTVTGQVVAGPELGASYWADNLRQPVRFAQAVQALVEDGYGLFLEMSPHPILVPSVQEVAQAAAAEVTAIGSLRRGHDERLALREALGALWVQGYPVAWERLFPAGAAGPQRVPLPTYPFQRQRYWVDPVPRGATPAGSAGRSPLSGVRVSMPGAVLHHVLAVGPRHQVFLGDHVVFGKVVVPGAFHLAVILSIAAELWPDRAIELTGVEFLRAIALEPGQEVELHAVLTPEAEEDHYQFEISTSATAQHRWTAHARGRVQPTDRPALALPGLEQLAGRATQRVDDAALRDLMSAVQIDWGPQWRWLREARVGAGVAVATLVPSFPNAYDLLPLPPILLDNGFGVTLLGSLLVPGDGTPRLPFAVERLRWWRAPSGSVRCVAIQRSLASDVADFTLVNEDGGIVAEVVGFAVRRAPRQAFLARDSSVTSGALYQLSWREAPLPKDSGRPSAGAWVVVGAVGSASAVALAAQLLHGVLTAPSGLAAILTTEASVAGVVCLWEAGAEEDPPTTALRVATQALLVVQALVARAPVRLWWVTAAAVAVHEGERVAVGTSPIWGLGRAVMQEHPELVCTLVDLEPGAEAIQALSRELLANDEESQVAWRAGLRFVARLLRVEPGTAAQKESIPKESTVLLTGGLGALALHVARWLAGQGVRHLVLAGRRGLATPGAAAAVAELEGLGAQVTVAAVDVADRSALAKVLERIPAALPLRGVVHAAGVLEDGVLAEQNAERFARVLAPKVTGVWNLHELTNGQALDLFVLFSSASGLLGAAGQANYAAANTFLDALAAERRADGLAGQSVAWGAWSEVGLAAALDATQRARLARQGIGWLSPPEGIALFERALARPEANLGAMALDFEALRQAFGSSVPPLWRALIRAKGGRVAATAQRAWAAKLATLPVARRAEEVRAAVQADVARVLGLGAASAAPLQRPFSELGLDSLMAIELRNALGQRVGKTLSATLAFDHPTVDALTRWLLDEVLSGPEPAPVVPQAKPAATDEPIAIIGAGCRYPGGVTDLESFWRLLDGGIDAIGEVPRARWDADALYDPDPDAKGKITTRCGGFVADIDQFDASFFDIQPREAAKLDPQQRLLLETSWEALGRAGITTQQVMGSDTGVFVGLMSHEYAMLAGSSSEAFDGYVSTGTAGSVASGRISYVLGLKGPSLTVDTACSSSLVTVHLACQALRQGECALALAGGVTLMLTPALFLDFSRLRGMAPDGRCKSFAATADGAGWGEGCGMLVLKRLSFAQRDGDPILAVIRGSAVNQDGRSNGLTAPNGPSQEALIRHTLAQAGIAPAQVSYVECHGTGTWLGDPIEVQALGAVLAQGRSKDQPLLIGSVKSNLGHTQAAAGVAGLLKVVLALQHERIPQSLHVAVPNPHVPWTELLVKVASEAVAWPHSSVPRRAGVSSFGISGTNAHVVLEEAPAVAPPQPLPARSAELVVLSAKSAAALAAQGTQLMAHLGAHPEQGLGALAFSLATTRSAMAHRLAVVASTRGGLAAALESVAQGQTPQGVSRGWALSPFAAKVVFVFPGQGSQWLGMGQKLLGQEPVFRQAMEACERAIQAEAGFSLLAELAAPESASQLDRIEVVQPLLFALSVALAELWRSWGVTPDAVVGHSMGEVAAAHVAGALSLTDAVAIICRRSRLLQQLGGQGAMAVVELSHAEAEAALAGYEERLGVAASNSPRSTVLSGEPAALAEVLVRLEAQGVFCRRVKVDVASHSPQVEPLRGDLVAALAALAPQRVKVPMRSTVTGAAVRGPELGAGYWADNLRQPVRFAAAVQALAESGHGLFVEMSPHPILVPAVEESLRAAQRPGVVVGSLRRGQDERVALLEALGAVWVRGYPVDWAGLFPAGGCRVPLPSYPFQRERYWLDAPGQAAPDLSAPAGGHPLLGKGVTVATQPRLWVAQTSLTTTRLPWLLDHRVQGAVVFPGAAYLEMALAAGAEQLAHAPLELTNVVFAQALAFADAAAVTVQLLATEESPNRLRFQIASRPPGSGHLPWTPHTRGTVQRAESAALPGPVDLAALRARLGAPLSRPGIYAALATRGLEYGPAFQGLSELRRGPDEALGTVHLPAVAGPAAAYQIHPALLDACLQVMAGTLDDGDQAAWVPVAVGAVRLLRRPAGELFCQARLMPTDPAAAQRRSADLLVVDAGGAPVVEIRGLAVQRLATGSQPDQQDKGFLELDWELAQVPAPTVAAGRFLLLGAGDGLGTALKAALAAAGHTVLHTVATDPSASAVRARLGGAFGAQAPTAVVHLGSLAGGGELNAQSVERALVGGCDSVLATVQALADLGFRDAPRLWLVTRGAQAVLGGDVNAAQAPLLGLGRVIALEHAELRCARVDLDPARPAGELQALQAELLADDGEEEIALRGSQRRVARLAPWQPAAEPREKSEPAGGRPFCLEIDEIGVLDHLVLRALTRRPPGPGEVEIAVAAAGLNFLDVLLALGVMPSDVPGEPGAPLRLGGECAGRIVAVGAGVAGLAVGSPVIALARGAFASHVTVPATLVLPRPEGLSVTEAAALPVAYLTAFYALDRVARLERGERVLIHAATGGVGLAAVQWARHVGAEVYATAGSPEKRAYLESLGVKYVSDSRSDRFVADVQAWTGGEGVDVVLNSLSGELIQQSFALLRSHGRFVELGKRDYYADHQLGMRPFLRNLSFSLVDLRGMMLERPARVRALFDQLLGLIKEGVFTPPPILTFPIGQAAQMFRKMAQAQHLGKLVLTLDSPEVEIQVPRESGVTVRADGSYLVTGGLGGLGLSVAGWLAKKGAGHLVLVGRSGAASVEQQAAVAALAAHGARVTVAPANVADRGQLERILGAVAASEMPLRGVIHAAGLLDDELLVRQTPARFRAVMAPKVLGALHLDALTQNIPLDFFVLYSSGAGLLGSPGQGNYAAANTFLDALAHHRRARGLPALSIDWGAFSQVGLAAAQENRGGRLAARGIHSLTPAEGLSALARLLAGSRPQVGVVPLDIRQWVEFYPTAASSRMLTRLVAQQRAGAARPRGDQDLLKRLTSTMPAERVVLLQEVLRAQVSQVLRVPPGQLGLDVPLTSVGMDSLMGLELRNRIETTLGITMPAALLWTYPTLAALSGHLAGKTGAAAPSESAPSASATAELEEMSEDELTLLIAAKFEAHHE